jgi:hypothetical protein
MLAAWRGPNNAVTPAKKPAGVYEDEPHPVRGATGPGRTTVQPGTAPAVRTGTDGSKR